MSAPLRRFASAQSLGAAAAAEIAEGIRKAGKANEPYVLGCPSGRTPRSTYRALVRAAAEEDLDLGHVVLAMVDEFVEHDPDTGAPHRVADHLAHSCVRFGREEILRPLNAASGGTSIPDEHLWSPSPGDPAEYEARLAAVGGIDFMILAVGASDGHVAFNPPGSQADSRTRIVELATATRRDNMQTFPTFASLDQVPGFGVTVGIATIREHAARAVLLATGGAKQAAVARLAAAQSYEPDWPATVIHDCAGGEIWADAAAWPAAPHG